jgi:hypothetical protein
MGGAAPGRHRGHVPALDGADALAGPRGAPGTEEGTRGAARAQADRDRGPHPGDGAVGRAGQEDEAITLWWPLAADGRNRLERIDGGVELRLHGRNKGTAVLSMISQAPPGTFGVFVGDDATDEDAFAAV